MNQSEINSIEKQTEQDYPYLKDTGFIYEIKHAINATNKSKATGDKNSGYTNTVKINNTTYRANKDIIYSHLSKVIHFTFELYEAGQYINSDIKKLKKYIPIINK